MFALKINIWNDIIHKKHFENSFIRISSIIRCVLFHYVISHLVLFFAFLGKRFESATGNRKWKSTKKNISAGVQHSLYLILSSLKIVYLDSKEKKYFALTFVRMVQDQSANQRNAATIPINLSCLNAEHFDFPKNKHHFLTSSLVFAFSNYYFFMTQNAAIKQTLYS